MTPRIAIVTGAGQGVGRAIAVQLASAGHRVALVGRDSDKLESVAQELAGPSLCISVDLTDPSGVEAAFDTVERTWGPADILVANAGASLAASVVDTTDEQW